MARLASVVKQGYFPAPPEAVTGILRHLRIPEPPPDSRFKVEDVNILDPCAGEARALVQIAEGLGVSMGDAFAVERNARRAATIGEGPDPDGQRVATNRIAFLVQQGLRLLAETEGGDPEECLYPIDAED